MILDTLDFISAWIMESTKEELFLAGLCGAVFWLLLCWVTVTVDSNGR